MKATGAAKGSAPALAEHQAGFIASRALPNGLGELYLGAAEQLRPDLPGNGGLRLWHYESDDKAKTEALGLGQGMAFKHDTYNTG